VRQHYIARFVPRLKRTDGAHAQDPAHAELLHRPDVRPMVEFTREHPMAAPMPGQKDNIASRQLASQQLSGGRAEWGFEVDPPLLSEPLDVVQSTATYYTYA